MTNIAENGIITINAGDYFEHPLFINAGTEISPLRYILQTGDKVYISIVEPNQPFECGVVRKTFDKNDLNFKGDVTVVLTESDTENLLPGMYYYEAKLSIKCGETNRLSTIIPRRKFFIM